jgi:hypothetical protein
VCEHNSRKRLYSHFGNQVGVRDEGLNWLRQKSRAQGILVSYDSVRGVRGQISSISISDLALEFPSATSSPDS